MSVLAAIALATVVAATPIHAERWVTPDDYPSGPLSKNLGGHTSFRLTVSAAGRPVHCDITYTSQSAELDMATCKLLMKRATFAPARDAAGNPAVSVYRNTNSWWTSRMKPLPERPAHEDMSLVVNKLPADIASPARAAVAFAVDPGGAISDCTPILAEAASTREQADIAQRQHVADVLGKIACGQIMANIKPRAALDDAGRPVASIQTAIVAFTASAP